MTGPAIRYGASPGRTPAPGAILSGAHGARSVIGTAAEDYLRAALGLELWPSEAAYGVGEAHHSPDLWAAERRLVVEVKAALAGRRWYLTEAQLRAYLAIGSTEGPAGADWPLPAPLISYALVAYQLPQPPGRYRDAVALYRAVHPDTAAAGFGIRRVLILPVEVLEHTTREWGTSQEYTTPLSPMLGTWAPYRRAPPGRLWALWGADPAEAVQRAPAGPGAACWGYLGRSWSLDGAGGPVVFAEVAGPPRPAWEGPLLWSPAGLPLAWASDEAAAAWEELPF